MRTQLLHLSGPLRGQTRLYGGERVVCGTGARAAVRYPASTGGVEPEHAEIVYRPQACSFHLRRRDGRVFVNQREVEEVILEDDDLIEFGEGGPKARFRIHVEPGEFCKPVRQMLGDARQVGRASGLVASGHSLVRDLLTHATLRLKIGFPVAVAVLAFAAAWLGGWLGGRGPRVALAEHWQAQAERYEAELGAMRQRSELAEARQAQLRVEFDRRAAMVDEIARDHVALRQALDEYARGVCLLEGAFAFRRAADGEPLRNDAGAPVEFEYLGSGFLINAAGDVVTNRHVAQPWFGNADAEALVGTGYEPVLLHLRAWFPGRPPIEIDPLATRLRSDDIDVALLRIDPSGGRLHDVPVLPISSNEPTSYKGGHILVLGYPTGVHALLARMESAELDAVTSAAHTLPELIAQLAERNAIAPLATQGALSDVLPTRLIFDAPTTQGGSGGPVFGIDGRVIGVTFAVLRDFGGSNLGVPIRCAMELVR